MVSFDNPYDSNIEPLKHNKYKDLFINDLDDLEDYIFQGWYYDSKFRTKFNNGSKPKESFTLYARWMPRYHDKVCIYGFNENEQEFYIKKINNTNTNEATIPEKYNGLPITKLYNSAIPKNLIRLNFSDNLQTLIIDDFSSIIKSKIRFLTIGKDYQGVDLSLLSNSEEYSLSSLNNLKEEVLSGVIFSFFPLLESITVSDEHIFLEANNGVLFTKEESSLVCYPSDRRFFTYEIPEGVEIFYNCFSSNEYLTILKIPESLRSFESNRFDEFPNLAEIDIHPDNNYYTYIDRVLYSKDMKILYFYSLRKYDKIFAIPEGVESCESYSFSKNIYLEELIISSSVKNMNTQYYHYLESLTYIMVNENNPNYSSLDGVLYSKNQDTLYFYPKSIPLETYTVPLSVTIIKSYAFYSCFSLKNIYLSKNVTTVESTAFGKMHISIFCEAESKPELWENDWYYDKSSFSGIYSTKIFWDREYPQ